MNLPQLQEIFDHQRQLANQFQEIETKNLRIPHSIPINVNSYQGQAVLRLYATYFHEEIWEAQTAVAEELGAQVELEELSDAFHFLVDLCLFTEVHPETLAASADRDELLGVAFGEFLHTLKAKPWKKNPTTVPSSIRLTLTWTFHAFMKHVRRAGFTEAQLYEAYFAKAKINQARIDSGV
jgi:dimeric dUTPase (all-alpha-NTP-PPase superfamily)